MIDPEPAASYMITDLDMKGVNGFELYKSMRQIDDKVSVCFMTDLRARHIKEFRTSFPDFPSTNLVEKPVGTDDLLEFLRLNLVDNK